MEGFSYKALGCAGNVGSNAFQADISMNPALSIPVSRETKHYKPLKIE